MEQPPRRSVFWTRRRRVWAALISLLLAALAAAALWLPDWGLRYGLVRSLRDLGWPRVSISTADLSLFKGTIVVRQVQAGEELGRMLGVDGLDLRFRWKPLFSRRVSVEHLDLSGVDIDITRQGDEVVINGLPLAVGGGGESPDSGWSYDVTSLTLTGSRIRLGDGALKAEIEVDRLEIADLRSWEPDQPTRYTLRGRINGAPIEIVGTATPFAAKPGLQARLRLDGFDLAAVAPLVEAAGGGALAGRVSAELALGGGMDAALTADGNVTLAALAWGKDGTTVAAERLTAIVAGLRWDKGRLSLAGSAEAKALRVEDGGLVESAGTAKLAAEELGWDGRLLTWRGTLHADHHSIVTSDARLEHGALAWTGTTRLDFAPKASSFFHGEGKADLADVVSSFGDLTVEARKLAAEGVFEHARPDGMLPPLVGRLTASAEQVRLAQGAQDWLRAERLDARDIRLTTTAALLGRLEGRGVAALSRTGKGAYSPRLEARQMILERANLAADGAVSAASLSLTGALARISRDKGGITGLPEDHGKQESGAMPRLALGRLSVADSRVNFDDRTPGERVRLRVEGLDLAVSDLDSAQPDHDSPFTAKARIGVAQLAAQGKARPFAVLPGADIKGSVRSLDLPPLSPYAADSLGVHLQTGQLDADVTLAVTQGKLDGGMQLTLSELFVAQPDPNAPLAKSADMPIETVLDLLRDSENRIRLSIPVRGDLANPDFDISDAVGQAVGGALKSTMFTTLKVAFPLAGLISLVIDDSESRRLALDPLSFAPGGDALGDLERQRLGVVAGLMADKPSLKLTLCGVAVETTDAVALAERRRQDELGLFAKLQKLVGSGAPPEPQPRDRERLTRLADSRAQAAKAYLVEQGGVDAGRLFTCRPRVDADAQALPRVDLLI